MFYKYFKQILFLLILIFSFILLNCDDGDINYEDIRFENNNLNPCNNGFPNFYLFNIQDNQAYILQISEGLFQNRQNINNPLQVPIGNQVSLILRTYSRSVENSDICNTIPPANLGVVSERIAQSGTIEVVTRAIKTQADNNNATRISSYRHQVRIKNLTFAFDGQFQTTDLLELGFYNTASTPFSNFQNTNVQSCDNNQLLFKINQNQALELNVPASMFVNQATTPGSPRTALIDGSHIFRYLVFPDFINQTVFCGGALFNPTETWVAKNGENGLSGIIEVSTVEDTDPNTAQTIFKHNIVLKKLTMLRPLDEIDFLLGDVYEFGEYITN